MHSSGSQPAFRKSPPRPTGCPSEAGHPPLCRSWRGIQRAAQRRKVPGARDAEARSAGIPREGSRQVPGVTLPKTGVPGRGLELGSRSSHLPTAPAPAPPGSRAPRRAAASPPEGIRGRPWSVAETVPPPGPADPQRLPAAGSGRGAAGAAAHRCEHERGRLRLRSAPETRVRG